MRNACLALLLVIAGVGCSTSSASQYAIVAKSSLTDAQLSGVAGDAIALAVIERGADGTVHELPASTTVAWTIPATVTAADPTASDPPDLLPPAGAIPSGTFVANPPRPDITDDLDGVLFVLDAGTSGSGALEVSATVSSDPDHPVMASIAVAETPVGDAIAGSGSYINDCSNCHGPTGDGSPAGSDGMYDLYGTEYPYPAPGLNDAPGKGYLASNPAWNAALFAFASRADCNVKGVALRVPMPSWLADAAVATQQPPTTQELADIYAYLVGETQ